LVEIPSVMTHAPITLEKSPAAGTKAAMPQHTRGNECRQDGLNHLSVAVETSKDLKDRLTPAAEKNKK
ncbi:hypothetical protein KYX90_13440, partial [Enterococcus lactis]|nr:hypothetical protein [Enterococcus lactis]